MQVSELCRYLFANSCAAFDFGTSLSPTLHCSIRQRVLREKSQQHHLIAISKIVTAFTPLARRTMDPFIINKDTVIHGNQKNYL
jgi:hypothetical protein